MALVNCDECGRPVSSDAFVCLHCGARQDPVSKGRRDYWRCLATPEGQKAQREMDAYDNFRDTLIVAGIVIAGYGIAAYNFDWFPFEKAPTVSVPSQPSEQAGNPADHPTGAASSGQSEPAAPQTPTSPSVADKEPYEDLGPSDGNSGRLSAIGLTEDEVYKSLGLPGSHSLDSTSGLTKWLYGKDGMTVALIICGGRVCWVGYVNQSGADLTTEQVKQLLRENSSGNKWQKSEYRSLPGWRRSDGVVTAYRYGTSLMFHSDAWISACTQPAARQQAMQASPGELAQIRARIQGLDHQIAVLGGDPNHPAVRMALQQREQLIQEYQALGGQ